MATTVAIVANVFLRHSFYHEGIIVFPIVLLQK